MNLTRSQLDQILLEEIKAALIEVSPGQFASPESRAKYKEKARKLRARSQKAKKGADAPKKEPPKRKKKNPNFKSDEAQMLWDLGDPIRSMVAAIEAGEMDDPLGGMSPTEIYKIYVDRYLGGDRDLDRRNPKDAGVIIGALEARLEKIGGDQKADAPKSTDLTGGAFGGEPKSTDLTGGSEIRLEPSGGPNVELDLTGDAIKAVEDKVIDNISDPALKNKAEKAKKASAGTLATIVSNVGKPGTWSPAEYKRLKNAGFSDKEIVSLKQMFLRGSKKIADAEPERGDLVAAATLLARGITPDQLKLAKYKEKDWLEDIPTSTKATGSGKGKDFDDRRQAVSSRVRDTQGFTKPLGPGSGRFRKNKKSTATEAPPPPAEKSTSPLGALWPKRYSEGLQLDLSRLLEFIDDEIRNFKNIN